MLLEWSSSLRRSIKGSTRREDRSHWTWGLISHVIYQATLMYKYLCNVVQEAQDFGFNSCLSWKRVQHVQKQLHPFFVQKHLGNLINLHFWPTIVHQFESKLYWTTHFTCPGWLISEIPQCREGELHGDVHDVVLHSPPHNWQQLLHVGRLRAQGRGLLRRNLSSQDAGKF